MRVYPKAIVMMLMILLGCSGAWAQKTVYVPSGLKAWEKWVMHDHQDCECPPLYHDFNVRVCQWPNTLELDFNRRGGHFSQSWEALTSGMIPLPGDALFWPGNVRVDGKPAPVTLHDGTPAVFLEQGLHRVQGEFSWHDPSGKIPQTFPIPALTGLVALTVEGHRNPSPFIDENHRIWIQKTRAREADPALPNIIDTVDVRIFRLIEDSAPMQIHNVIRLTVSGDRRRIRLDNVLLQAFRPVSMESPLPARLSPAGALWVEVKPGEWEIRILGVINRPVRELGPATAPYGDEIWAFKSYPELRVVSVGGLPAIDPGQTTMPPRWQQYTSFLVKKGAVAQFRETRRGSPETAMDTLTLNREVWLDFDGRGMTIRDRITGRLARRRFLGIGDDRYQLGRLTLNGKDQLVTRLNDRETGIEIEKGAVDLIAVSRLNRADSSRRAFMIGWNDAFQSARGILHIPPGWQLLGVQGGQTPKDATWLGRWSLLDCFLILVISFAVAKLWRGWWGILFAFGLSLIWHEACAPRYVWLHLVIVTALIRLVKKGEPPEGTTLRMRLLGFWNLAALVTLIGGGLIFAYLQLREAVYPQLAPPSPVYYDMMGGMTKSKMSESVRPSAAPPLALKSLDADKRLSSMAVVQEAEDLMRSRNKAYLHTEPGEAIQTGPGIPAWKWKTVSIDYGQIEGAHQVAFFWLSPIKNALLCVMRVALLLMLAVRFFGIPPSRIRFEISKVIPGASLMLLLLITGRAMALPVEAAFPPQSLLDELESRLTASDDCFPHCADIGNAVVTIKSLSGNKGKTPVVVIDMDIHAAVKTAVPLPAGGVTWRPDHLLLDQKAHPAAAYRDSRLWTWIPAGVHHLEVSGTMNAGSERIGIVFPLRPRFVDVTVPGWEIRGLDENHQVGQMLVLTRKKDKADGSGKPETDALGIDEISGLSDFLLVRRSILLGIEWRVITQVKRLAVYPGQKAIVASIPLLKDERVRSEFLKVSRHTAQIEMPPDVNRIEWLSSLPIGSNLELSVPQTAEWAEVWHLDASPLWHYEANGLPLVFQDDQTGMLCYPWPGEQLDIGIVRLPAARGESLTIDSARLDYFMGEEYNRIVLKTAIRTSQGTQYSLQGPPDGKPVHVRINGRSFPVSESVKQLMLPLQPGSQAIEIEWKQPVDGRALGILDVVMPKRLVSPRIDLTQQVNNIDMYWHLPKRLWLLMTFGPRLGPAVLFWSYFAVMGLAAVLLGRFAPSPLNVRQWFLLGIGMVTVNVNTVVLVAGWFIAVEWRQKRTPSSRLLFNLMQIGLVGWSLIVAVALYQAVQNGLLGIPDMQVAGNGSQGHLLHWTVDRAAGVLPRPCVFSGSIYFYRALMFCWALWLARNAVAWARWAVQAMRQNGAWRKKRLKTITVARK